MKKVTYLNCTIKIIVLLWIRTLFFELKFISRFQSPSIASVTCCFYSLVNKVGGDYYSFGPLCLFQFQPQQTMIYSSFSPQQNKIQHLSMDPKKKLNTYTIQKGAFRSVDLIWIIIFLVTTTIMIILLSHFLISRYDITIYFYMLIIKKVLQNIEVSHSNIWWWQTRRGESEKRGGELRQILHFGDMIFTYITEK